MGREVTDWISRARVTRERQSLATAAAVIFKPPQTTGARLLHPVSALKGTEGGLTVSRMPLRPVPAAFGDTRPPTQLA